MDNSVKKKLKIAFSVAAIVLAVGIFLMTGTKENMADQDKKVIMMCLNCQETFEINKKKLDKLVEANSSGDDQNLLMPDMKGMTFECKLCGEKEARIAMKCKKCDSIFEVNYGATGDYSDRCPDCGYSSAESLRSGE